MDHFKTVVPSQLLADRGSKLVAINPGSGIVGRAESSEENEVDAPTGPRNIDEVLTFDSGVKKSDLVDVLGGSVPDLDLKTLVPRLGDRPHRPPAGFVTLYLEYFAYKFTVPYHALMGEILSTHGLCISQLNPQFFGHIGAFFTGLTTIGAVIDLAAFQSLFVIKQVNAWPFVFLQARGDRLIYVPTRQKVTWRKKFFYFPASRLGFPSPSEWNLALAPTSAPDDHVEKRKEYLELGLFGLFDVTKKKKSEIGSEAICPSPTVAAVSLAKGSTEESSSKVAPKAVGVGKGKTLQVERRKGKKPRAIDLAAMMAKIPQKGEKVREAAPISARIASTPVSKSVERSGSPDVVHVPRPSSLGKRPREVSPGTLSRRGIGNGLFIYGINKQLGVRSLWDTSEPGVAHDLTRDLINPHDSWRLGSMPPDELERQICGGAGRAVQLASELRAQAEAAAARVAQLEREAVAHQEAMKKVEATIASLEKGSAEMTAKLKGALTDLEAEAKHGQRYLASDAGRAHDAEVRREAVETYRDSEEFENELSAGSEAVVVGAIAATVRDCRGKLRAHDAYRGDDFAWLYPDVPDLSDNEGGDGGDDKDDDGDD